MKYHLKRIFSHIFLLFVLTDTKCTARTAHAVHDGPGFIILAKENAIINVLPAHLRMNLSNVDNKLLETDIESLIEWSLFVRLYIITGFNLFLYFV